MTTKRKVITSFVTGNYDDPGLHLIAEVAIEDLTGNATFPGNDTVPPLTQPPAPAPATPNLTDASADFFDKLKAARNGSTLDTAEKDASRVILEGMLNKWANYVNLVADGNVIKLRTSGFDLNEEKQKKGILPAPDGLRVSSPGLGQLEAKLIPVKGAGGYNFRITEVDFSTEAPVPGVQPFTVSTVPGNLFMADDPRLVRTKCYKIEASAIGSDRTAVNWSDPAFVVIS